MIKTAITCLFLLTSSFVFCQPSSEAIVKLIGKPKSSVEVALLKEGYQFQDMDDDLFVYVHPTTYGAFVIRTLYKNDKLSVISVNSHRGFFYNWTSDLTSNGFVYHPLKNQTAKPLPVPSTMYRYDNPKLNITCAIICPMNMEESNEILMNYYRTN